MHKRFFDGFTIVEVLAVITMIAILASVTVIGYRGVQNRGYDTAVQSDLSKFAERMGAFHSKNGHYPATTSELTSIDGIKFSRSNYDTSSGHNLLYCFTDTTGINMRIVAKSRTGTYYSIENEDTIKKNVLTTTTACTDGVDYTNQIAIYSGYTGWLSNF